MKSKGLLLIILTIGLGVGSFFAGMKYQQSRQRPEPDFQGLGGARTGRAQQRWQQRGPGMIRGEIIAQDKETVTVKLPNGSSKIVFLSENTKINKMVEGSVDDLGVGKQVMVFGQENSDKTISAQNIQLVPNLGEEK